MSDDFIGGLQDDLVAAMERYELRSRRPRLGPIPHLRPAALAGAAAIVALIVALAVLARNLAPEPSPARPHVVGVLRIGGTPMDAVVADGSLWATDYAGSLVQVDPIDRRIVGRMPLTGSPVPIVTDGRFIWVETAGKDCRGELLRIDASRRRVVRRRPWAYPNEQIGVLADGGGGVLWAKRGCVFRQGIDRLDARGAVSAHVALATIDGMAVGGGNLWVIGHDGTLTELDAASGRVRGRWPGLAPLSLADSISWNTKALVADGDGVWAISTRRAAIFHVESGHVSARIPIPPTARPLLARAPDGLWIATADRLGANNRLIRIDPATRRPTATVQLGTQRPVALIPVDGQLCVITGNGGIVFIRS